MSTLSGGPNIVTNGLVLYYDAANISSYISGSSVINNMMNQSAFAISTFGNTKTLFENNPPALFVTQSSGNADNPLVFDFTFNENQSIELWYKTSATGSGISNQGESPGIVQVGYYNNNASLTLWDWSANTPNQHDLRTYVNNGTTWSHVQSSTGYSDANWVNRYHHIVLNFSGNSGKWNTYKLYVDNNLQYTLNFTTPFPSSSIGGGNKIYLPGAYGGSAKNSYSILKVYTRELSTSEILQNYNAQKSRFGLM
jgi:hypothetical protein